MFSFSLSLYWKFCHFIMGALSPPFFIQTRLYLYILNYFRIFVVKFIKTMKKYEFHKNNLESPVEITMKYPDNGVCNMEYDQVINNFGSLGREIKISPKAHVVVNNPGFKITYHVETVSICIGIGNDHTAELSMTMDALKALNNGAVVNVITAKEFKEKFL